MQNKANKSPAKNYDWQIYLLLAVVTAVCFWQVRNFDFTTYDDNSYVYENPHVLSGLNINNVVWAFTTGHTGYWHPLTWLSFMLDCQLFGANAGEMHLVNLFLHIANALLLFAVFKKMTGSQWPSAFVAAVFAIHPMHVESVAWIAERKDVLSAFFWLLTLAAYIGYVRRPSALRYILMLAIFGIALLAKPMAVTLPFVLLLLDYWPLNRFDLQSKNSGSGKKPKTAPNLSRHSVLYRLVIEKIPFFALSGALSVITFLIQLESGIAAKVENFSLSNRFSNAFISYAKYIGKLVWPENLAVFYPYDTGSFTVMRVSLSVLLLAAITILVIYFGAKKKYLVTGWFWFVGTLVPVIGFVQSGGQAFADRYTYIPYIGLSIMAAWGLPELLSKLAHRKIIVGVSMLVVVAVLGACTKRQADYWKNTTTLFSHAIDVTKDNYIAYMALADELSNQGKNNLAFEYYTKSLKIQPTNAYAYNNLGLALQSEGKYAQALVHFGKAVEIMPDLGKARYNFSKALAMQGQTEKALQQFRETIRLMPDQPEPMNDFALLVVSHPEIKDRDINEAIAAARRACELTGYKKSAFLNTLAITYYSATRFKEAVVEMKRLAELEPNNPDVKNTLAWIYATCPDPNTRNPSEAIRLAQEACSATDYKKAGKLDTLAAAYASAGRFGEAIETAENALSLIGQNQTELYKAIQSRLDLYKASRPYLEVSKKG
jgi:tetratricopeptide (TPR) repeat protein